MIITFSDGIDSSMQILMILSSFACTIINNWIAIATLVASKKIEKNLNKQNAIN